MNTRAKSRTLLAAACLTLPACTSPRRELSADACFPPTWPDGTWLYSLTALDGAGPVEKELAFDGWYHERRALSQLGPAPFGDAYNQYVSDHRNKTILFALPEGIALELFGVHGHWVHYDPPLLILPAHARPGDRWIWHGQMSGRSTSRTSTLRVESLGRAESRPLLHVREQRDDGTLVDRWFAPELGLVALKEHRAGEVSLELTLVEFTPKVSAP